MYLQTELDIDPLDLISAFDNPTQIQSLMVAQDADAFEQAFKALDIGDRNALINFANQQGGRAANHHLFKRPNQSGVYVPSMRNSTIELTDRQLDIVNKQLTRPLIVQGVAGSGKTTLAINRLCSAANATTRLTGSVLFLTYNRTLSIICKELTRTACKGDIPTTVQINTFHAWIKDLLSNHGTHINIVYDAVYSRLLEESIRTVREQFGREFLPDELLVKKEDFWRTEFEEVIDNECNGDIEYYIEGCDRSTRCDDFPDALRAGISLVYQNFYEKLRAKNLSDFPGMVNLGFELYEQGKLQLPNYEEIIVDEAQDLTTNQLAFISHIARQTDANLILLGDENQSVYRHKFSWQSIRDRIGDCDMIELTTNHRTPGNIGQFANSILNKRNSQPVYDKIGGEHLKVITCNEKTEIYEAMLARIQELEHHGVLRNNIAVIALTTHELNTAKNILDEANIRTDIYNDELDAGISLSDTSIKLITIASAKGIEFDHIILLRIERNYFPGSRKKAEDKGINYEHWQTMHRQYLNVALTRAMLSATIISRKDFISPFIAELQITEETRP